MERGYSKDYNIDVNINVVFMAFGICIRCHHLLFLCRPFDAATYEDEVDDDDIMDEEGRTRLKLKVSGDSLGSAAYRVFYLSFTRNCCL